MTLKSFLLIASMLTIGAIANAQDGQVCFYSDANYQGYSFCRYAGQNESNLDYMGMNNQISSIRIIGNVSVTLFENSNFSGARLDIGRDISNLGNTVWNDNISSLVVNREFNQPPPNYPPPPPYNPPGQYDQVCFYEDAGYQGASFCLYRGQRVYDLGAGGGYWNDRISSIRFFGRARVRVFRDANFSGLGTDFNQDVINLRFSGPWWNDSISSIGVE